MRIALRVALSVALLGASAVAILPTFFCFGVPYSALQVIQAAQLGLALLAAGLAWVRSPAWSLAPFGLVVALTVVCIAITEAAPFG